jgi:hypothetical protein
MKVVFTDLHVALLDARTCSFEAERPALGLDPGPQFPISSAFGRSAGPHHCSVALAGPARSS